MARKPPPIEVTRSANITAEAARLAIPSIQKRIDELAALDLENDANCDNSLDGVRLKINATLRDILGADTIEYKEYEVGDLRAFVTILVSGSQANNLYNRRPRIKSRIGNVTTKLQTLCELLAERAGTNNADSGGRVIRAYEGLDLHPEIARAASKRYLDGHFADAVEASVKALNGLVRMRSGLEFDGTSLMERAFSPTNPVLKFNALTDQSDKDEQKGFMMMFSGAVSGLRNPRAHGFIQDDPERALEFIAYVSLLAKLLDGAAQ